MTIAHLLLAVAFGCVTWNIVTSILNGALLQRACPRQAP
jgi:hypothetical protein